MSRPLAESAEAGCLAGLVFLGLLIAIGVIIVAGFDLDECDDRDGVLARTLVGYECIPRRAPRNRAVTRP